MNTQRANEWQSVAENIRDRINTVDERFPGLDPTLRQSMVNYDQQMLAEAEGFVQYHST